MNAALGRITRNGHDLTGQLPIFFDDRLGAALDGWGGTFHVPQGGNVELLAGCRLQMVDGRSGDITLYRRDAGADRSTVIHFQGVGSFASH